MVDEMQQPHILALRHAGTAALGTIVLSTKPQFSCSKLVAQNSSTSSAEPSSSRTLRRVISTAHLSVNNLVIRNMQQSTHGLTDFNHYYTPQRLSNTMLNLVFKRWAFFSSKKLLHPSCSTTLSEKQQSCKLFSTMFYAVSLC